MRQLLIRREPGASGGPVKSGGELEEGEIETTERGREERGDEHQGERTETGAEPLTASNPTGRPNPRLIEVLDPGDPIGDAEADSCLEQSEDPAKEWGGDQRTDGVRRVQERERRRDDQRRHQHKATDPTTAQTLGSTNIAARHSRRLSDLSYCVNWGGSGGGQLLTSAPPDRRSEHETTDPDPHDPECTGA